MLVRLIEVVMALFVFLLVPVFLVLFVLVFHGHVQICLNLLNKLGDFVLGDFVLFEDVRMLSVELVDDFLDVRVENKSLKKDGVNPLAVILLALVAVVDSDERGFHSGAYSYVKDQLPKYSTPSFDIIQIIRLLQNTKNINSPITCITLPSFQSILVFIHYQYSGFYSLSGQITSVLADRTRAWFMAVWISLVRLGITEPNGLHEAIITFGWRLEDIPRCPQ